MNPNPYASKSSNEKKAELKLILMQSHLGQERAVKKVDLIRKLWGDAAANDQSYNSRFDRSLRAMIEELNHEGGLVCSSPSSGYWWADSLDDGLPAAQSLIARASVQMDNARTLEKNIVKAYGGQMALMP